jgi:hypothetical protein
MRRKPSCLEWSAAVHHHPRMRSDDQLLQVGVDTKCVTMLLQRRAHSPDTGLNNDCQGNLRVQTLLACIFSIAGSFELFRHDRIYCVPAGPMRSTCCCVHAALRCLFHSDALSHECPANTCNTPCWHIGTHSLKWLCRAHHLKWLCCAHHWCKR